MGCRRRSTQASRKWENYGQEYQMGPLLIYWSQDNRKYLKVSFDYIIKLDTFNLIIYLRFYKKSQIIIVNLFILSFFKIRPVQYVLNINQLFLKVSGFFTLEIQILSWIWKSDCVPITTVVEDFINFILTKSNS